MNFRLLVFFISVVFAATLAVTGYVYQPEGSHPWVILVISFVVTYILLANILEKYINQRIANIYKLIRNLKLGKDFKEVLAEHANEDPIKHTEQEVEDWAKQRVTEIARLREQERYRREFLSNISHEFKTPLFSIQGYIETLQDGILEEDPEMARKFLDKAAKNIDRLAYLIGDLDEISKLESGKISLSMEKFDIIQLILETKGHLVDKAAKSQIELVFKSKNSGPLYVKADRLKIQQVLVNLIDNSIKYGRENGKTSISVYSLLDQILVEVTDNGFGIEEKNLPRVFERFFRTDKSRSRDIGGSGLGLSIVKHILEAHQQTVNVRSTEGVGTTFGFTVAKA